MEGNPSNHFPDRLFRDKLEGHEEHVSNAVWDRLSEKVEQGSVPFWKNRKVQVAAVAAGMLMGGSLWLGIGEFASEESLAGIVHLEEPADEVVSPVEIAETEAIADLATSVSPIVAESEQREERKFLKSERSAPALAPPSAASNDGPTDTSPDRDDKKGVPVGTIAATAEPETEKVETRVLVVYVKPAVLSDTEAAQPQTMVSESESPVATAAPVKEKKRGIQRFFRQLKNAKTGEKIDWEELGLNPNRTFANAEPPSQ